LTVKVILTHAVELHVPIALEKYVVVAAGLTINVEPEPINVPPGHEPVYQYQKAPVPKLPPLKLSVDEPPGTGMHNVSGLAFAESAAIESELTVIVLLTQVVELQ
jgi:hypothetical protein